ncbi:MAG: hypothetical protein QOC55_540, partial [Thermoleophilaceae bacterium]|nr:hypothetical protein [Thermoleophilaceae bacterium]
PQRTLERGYALALGPDGEPLGTTAGVREAAVFDLRMADGVVPARLRDDADAPPPSDPHAQPSLLQDSLPDGD